MVAFTQKGIVFFVIILTIAFCLYFLLFFGEVLILLGKNLLWLILLFLFVGFIWRLDILKLKDYERAVIFRFGKLNRVGGPGWALILPFIEAYQHVDLRTKTLDVEKQDTVTRDSIEIRIDAVIYLKVRRDNKSVINSVLEVEDFQTAARTFVVATIRDIVGGMNLSEVISRIDEVNKKLEGELSRIAGEWGVRVIGVQIKDLEIPPTVLNAMHEQKAAVQEKLSRIEKAMAHRVEIDAVKEAAAGLSDRALNYYYIKALEEMSHGRSTKLIFPLQFSNLAQSIGNRLGGMQSNEHLPESLKKALDTHISRAVEKATKDKKK